MATIVDTSQKFEEIGLCKLANTNLVQVDLAQPNVG